MKTFKIITYYIATGLLGLLGLVIANMLYEIYSIDDFVIPATPSAFMLILFLIRNYPKRA